MSLWLTLLGVVIITPLICIGYRIETKAMANEDNEDSYWGLRSKKKPNESDDDVWGL